MTNETDGCVLDTNNNIVARTWSFTLQNLNLMPIHSITTLSKTPGVSFSVSPASFSGGLPYNGTVPVTLTITGGAAMQKVCVCLIARNQAGQEICREEFCRKLPCVKLSNIQVTCHPLGGVNIEFDWTNLSSTPVSYLSLGPTGSSQNIQPGGQSYSTPVPVGGTAHFGPVRWQGPNIAGEYCFSLGLANPSFLQCCVQKVCLLLPACPGPPYTGTGSGDHGGGQLCRTTHPQNQILTWPGSCVEVCDVNTFCHPTLPNTWYLMYRVSNIGNSTLNTQHTNRIRWACI